MFLDEGNLTGGEDEVHDFNLLQVLMNHNFPKLVGLLVYGIGLSGCLNGYPEDDGCEGEEVDFSIVGNLAGTWKTDKGWHLEFDQDHRLRRDEIEADFEEFGCEPGQWPLVLDETTTIRTGFNTYSWFWFADYEAESGRARLLHQRGSDRGNYVHRQIVVVDHDTLDYWRRTSPSNLWDDEWEAMRYTRISE